MRELLKSRRFRQGALATALTVLFIVLLVVINMVVTALATRYNLSLDLSEDRVFTLSRDSAELLRALEKDVTIYVLNSEDDFIAHDNYFMQANVMIRRCAQIQPRVSVRYVDLVTEPTFPALYPDFEFHPGDVLVESGANLVVLTPYDLFNTTIDTSSMVPVTYIVSSRAEQAISTAILNVTADKIIKVSVLTGFNEGGIDSFVELLRMNNFEVVYQNLMTEEIDPDATIAVLNAPTRDITEEEAHKLDEFLSNDEKLGKTLFYLASMRQQPEMPVIDAFLSEWGFKVAPGVVFETNNARLFQMNIYMTIADYMEGDFSRRVIEKNLIPAIAFSRPLELLFESSGLTITTGLLEFSATSGVMPPDAEPDFVPGPQDASGPILALGMGQRTRYEGLTPYVSTVVVSGSETLIDANLLGGASIANSEYILGLLGRLAGREEIIHVRNVTMGGEQLAVTYAQIIWITLALAVCVPLAVIVIGVVVWLRRRHK